MDASPVAMTLGDVLPGLQQGAIDGALATITVFTTFQYVDVAKYVIETDQPYLNSLVVMSKKWLATLPPDLQKIVRDDAAKVSTGDRSVRDRNSSPSSAMSGRARAAS